MTRDDVSSRRRISRGLNIKQHQPIQFSPQSYIQSDRMSTSQIMHRILRPSPSIRIIPLTRSFTSTTLRNTKGHDERDRAPSTAPEHRANQTSKPPNQFVPNTTSTMTNDYPNVGSRPAPPDMLNSVDPGYKPADPYPGRVEHFTGGMQQRGQQKPELGVGEMEGIKFKVEPLKREGEDSATMRARLLCSSFLTTRRHWMTN